MVTNKKPGLSTAEVLDIIKIMKGRATLWIYGESPLIYNSMNEKVMQGLLAPRKKSKAEQQATAKHNPLLEFRRSMYKEGGKETLLSLPAVSFKRAMASAALDLGGATKAQLERLLWAIGEQIPVWGIPELRMDVVRMKDIARTPDIRTRACLRQWVTRLELAYVQPQINATTVANLLEGAGLIRGVGDFRQEKGAGNYGQFTIVDPKAPEVQELMKSSGRAEQLKAFEKPAFYNEMSESLFTWWEAEMAKRGTALETDEDELLAIDEGEDEEETTERVTFEKPKANGGAQHA